MVGARSTTAARGGRPGATGPPKASTNPSGARSCVPLINGLPATYSSTRLPGEIGSMPKADTTSNRSLGPSRAISRPITVSRKP